MTHFARWESFDPANALSRPAVTPPAREDEGAVGEGSPDTIARSRARRLKARTAEGAVILRRSCLLHEPFGSFGEPAWMRALASTMAMEWPDAGVGESGKATVSFLHSRKERQR
jgi:hypothetical protein